MADERQKKNILKWLVEKSWFDEFTSLFSFLFRL